MGNGFCSYACVRANTVCILRYNLWKYSWANEKLVDPEVFDRSVTLTFKYYTASAHLFYVNNDYLSNNLQN